MNSIIEIFKIFNDNEYIIEIQKLIFSRDLKKELWTILNMSLASYKYEDNDIGFEKRAVMNYLLKTAAFHNISKLDDILEKYNDKIVTVIWNENTDSYLRNIRSGLINSDAHYQDKFLFKIQKFSERYKKQIVSKEKKLFDITYNYLNSIDDFNENRYLITYLTVTFAAYNIINYNIIVEKYNDIFYNFLHSQKSKITLT